MDALVKEVTDETFDRVVLQSELPVLVDLWAPWCAPCKALAPTVEGVAEKLKSMARVVKLNVDDNPAVAARYSIRAIPTLILFKHGKEVTRLVGAVREEELSGAILGQLEAGLN